MQEARQIALQIGRTSDAAYEEASARDYREWMAFREFDEYPRLIEPPNVPFKSLPMTRDEFVEDAMYELDANFNAGRPDGRRVKGKQHRNRVRRGLERGYDLREFGSQDTEAMRKEIRKAMFGNPLVAWFLSFIISNWGDDIIAWIIGKLFPVSGRNSLGELK